MLVRDSDSAWLAHVSWNDVQYINKELCAKRNAFHGPTSDGYDETKERWEASYLLVMPLTRAIELCRMSHRRQPFCFYNGNTFVAIIRDVVRPLLRHLEHSVQDHALNAIGAYVAGTSSREVLREVIVESLT